MHGSPFEMLLLKQVTSATSSTIFFAVLLQQAQNIASLDHMKTN